MYQGTQNAVVYAKCPYYQSDHERTITCEGMFCNQFTLNKFLTAKEKEDFMESFCMEYPNECTLCWELDILNGAGE